MSGVLIFHNILWSHYKGRVFSELYRICLDQSIDFFVMQYASTDSERAALGSIDLELHRYPYGLMTTGSYAELSLWRKIRLGFNEIRSKDPAIVVFPGYWDPSHWALLVIAKLLGKKVIIGFDSTALDRPRYWLKERIKRVFVYLCDGGFTYGQRSKQYLQQLGMPESKITIRCQATANDHIRDGYERARGDRESVIRELGLARRNFCYVGRLSKEKNVSCLLRAFAKLKRSNPEADGWGLLIVGDGPERQNLMDLCRREHVECVSFAGGVSWKHVSRYFAAGDVFVLPSLSEPWGLVVNEAMICGLPVIVSNRCGCLDDLVLDGWTGFSFDPSRADELCERMEFFVRSPGEIQRFGERAARVISHFTPEAAARQMFNGIERLLRESGGRSSKSL